MLLSLDVSFVDVVVLASLEVCGSRAVSPGTTRTGEHAQTQCFEICHILQGGGWASCVRPNSKCDEVLRWHHQTIEAEAPHDMQLQPCICESTDCAATASPFCLRGQII